jgi:hypothetical protein
MLTTAVKPRAAPATSSIARCDLDLFTVTAKGPKVMPAKPIAPPKPQSRCMRRSRDSSEEGTAQAPTPRRHVWIIDPLDGNDHDRAAAQAASRGPSTIPSATTSSRNAGAAFLNDRRIRVSLGSIEGMPDRHRLPAP